MEEEQGTGTERKFVTIEPGIWKPESEGDSIQGVLIQKRENVGVNESKAYMIEESPNKQSLVWGATVLDDRMGFVNVGDYVKITYKGKQKNKKNQDVKIYKVEKEEV